MADRLDSLKLLEGVLWDSITAADADKRASLAAQYRATLAEVADLEREAGKVADPVDEIAARRSARGGATARVRHSEGGAG